MPKITVIIPTHNRENLIGNSIESVLRQTCSDYDLIVLDDGSIDNTRGKVSSYQDPRIRYVFQEQYGVSVARNNAAKMAASEYLAFLDSDDVYLEHALAKLIDFLDAHQEVGFVYGQSYLVNMDEPQVQLRKSFYHKESIVIDRIAHIREMLFHKPWNVSCCAIRRDCFDDVGGFNEDLWYGEDYEFFVRMSKAYPAGYIAEPLANVRLHDSQLQDEVKPGKDKAFLAILREVFEDPYIAPYVGDLKARAYSHIYRTWLADAAFGLDTRLTRQRLRQAVGFYPLIILKPEIFYIVYKYATSLLPGNLRLRLKNIRRTFKSFVKIDAETDSLIKVNM